MTTTLRPLGPPRRSPQDRLSRRYAVCVNGRQVGSILVGAYRLADALVGQLGELDINTGAQRRGRGTVAVLAAEEILRQWGCTRVEAGIVAGPTSGPALALATALAYTEQSRRMVKPLVPAAPSPGAGWHYRVMLAAEYSTWRDRERGRQIGSLVERGIPEAQARARVDDMLSRHLASGVGTPGTLLRMIVADGVDIGTLWASVTGPGQPGQARVFSVEVAQEYQGRGYGRSLMWLAEAECGAAGALEVTVDVASSNTGAVGLFESLGYTVRHHFVAKPL